MKETHLNVAVVGAGYWGPNLIRNLLQIPNCHVRWVSDKSVGRQQFIAQQFPGVNVTPDASVVIDDPKVDAVFIATPLSSHYALGRAALEAGKHVFIEKPFTSSSAQAAELVEIADRRNLTLGVGHIFVHHPALIVMKNMADAGRVGKLCYAESARVNLGPPASEIDVIWDLAIHDIAIMTYLMDAAPVEVQARANRCVRRQLADVAFIRLQFANGFFSQHHVSWLSPDKVRRFAVFGEAGSLVFDDMASAKLRSVDAGVDTRVNLKDNDARELIYKPGEVVFPELPKEQPLERECTDFLNAIRNNCAPVADGRAGQLVVKLLECIAESASLNGKPIALDGAHGSAYVNQPFADLGPARM